MRLKALRFTGCIGDGTGSSESDITDVNHTDVERQSIGNCWLYAQASWVESMNLTRTGEAFDISQSYWTYWHWYGEITGYMYGDEISTGGNQWTSNDIIRERGIMAELDFVKEDSVGEMSSRQSSALKKLNAELKDGRLKTSESRRDYALVRDVMDEAWQLEPEVSAQLDAVFGEDGQTTLNDGGNVEGSNIIDPSTFLVSYTARDYDGNVTLKETNVLEAISDWRDVSYPSWGSDIETKRRNFLIRVQRALHDGQPVVITWDVDFNAMENDMDNPLVGSFNMTTLGEAGGPGRQGGHMTVLEDYEAETEEFGLLKAGETLDPNNEEDAAKLDALLLPSTDIKFLRIKNSWGSLRPDRGFAPGFPGYHDLYTDYLNGPIKFCPSVEDKTNENCTSTSTPLSKVMLPPGY